MNCAQRPEPTSYFDATPDVSGFTIVELIAVLLLLGILATTATSRMVSANAYAPALVCDQLIALGRLAQQTALTRQDAMVSLDVDQDAGAWRLRVQVASGAGTTTAREERAEIRNTGVVVINGAQTASLGPSAALRLTFDGLGNLNTGAVAATNLNTSVGVGISVTGDTAASVCVGSAGHAFRGACS